jgi:hypothetical protein
MIYANPHSKCVPGNAAVMIFLSKPAAKSFNPLWETILAHPGEASSLACKLFGAISLDAS